MGSEFYRPTEDEINAAKLGSNELFDKDVPHHLQPNRLRQSMNLAGLTGIWHGIYYISGIAQLPDREKYE